MKKNVLQYYSIQLCVVLISVITLFVTSSESISPQITLKKIGMFIIVAFAGLIYLFTSNCGRIKTTTTWKMCLAICVITFIQCFIIYGISFQALFPLVWVMLLFLWTSWGEIIDFKHMASLFVCFAFILTIQGFSQYLGFLSSSDYNFPITGSFDNPAGFSSALSCLFPFCLLYYKDNHSGLKYASWMVSFLIAFVIVLSGSRAGILAVGITLFVYLLVTIRTSRRAKMISTGVGIALLILLYLSKKDSADGRLLIWRCTLNLFMDNPIIGCGPGTFQAKYMLYQGEYFKNHPDSSFAFLADNVNHPFNEFFLVLTEHGIIGFSLVILFMFLLIRAYLLKPDHVNLVSLLSLLALATFSFFSYPFRYPFSWFILFMNITYLCKSRKEEIWEKGGRSIFMAKKIAIASLSLSILVYSSIMWKMETTWYRISQQALLKSSDELLSEYENMDCWLGKNGLFLYNYAAELHQAKKYLQSVDLFAQCVKHYNDMYVQMLLADSYYHNRDYQKAEYHYKLAANMCPSRYIPLYQLVQLYRDVGRNDEALVLAKQILEKEVKVESSTVYAIKYKMKEFVNELP